MRMFIVAVVTASVIAGITIALAGCGGPSRVAPARPHFARIRDNVSTPAQVRNHFAGKPAQTEHVGAGITCVFYGSPQAQIDGTGPVWVIRLCTRGLKS